MDNVIIFLDAVLYNSTGLLFVVLGVFILIRVSGFPDLTVDGSFSIGAAVYAVLVALGYGTFFALCVVALSGALGGLLTWTINTKLGVGKVVAGVLSMIILVLASPYVSGGSTQSLLNTNTIFTTISSWERSLSEFFIPTEAYRLHVIFSLFWLIIAACIFWIVHALLRTKIGLRLRYLGTSTNPTLLTADQRHVLLAVGLAVGNALVAIGGAIESQRRGGYTVNIGTGMILVAIAVLVLGESIIKSKKKREYLHLKEYLFAIVLGTLFYTIGVQGLLAFGLGVIDLRLATSVFLLLLLGIAGRYHSSSTKLF